MRLRQKEKVMIAAFAAIAIIPIVAISAAGNGAPVTSSATASMSSHEEHVSSSLVDESPAPFIQEDDEYTKSFLIAYPLAIPAENANKVSIDDYQWMSKLVKNGETIISSKDLAEFVEKYNTSPDFAIVMEDGITTRYLNINWYQDVLAPGVPYVKAYWEGVLPNNVASDRANLADIPALREAIEDKSHWVPLDNVDKVNAVEQLLKNTNTRHLEVTLENGVVEPFHIRYLDASHAEIIG